MNATERLVLLAELEGEYCELHHKNKHHAVDYIVQPFGYRESEVVEVEKYERVIPICKECQALMCNNDWTLLYCFSCGESRWIHRPTAKNKYRHNILWLRGCPECSGQFGGLYFSD